MSEQTTQNRFSSFAILDLETSNLPQHNFNKVGITELCIYGFSSVELDKPTMHLPRVLHKLTLMLNPRMAIDPKAEEITGLDNYMLEDQSYFNENAANTVLGFLKHLQGTNNNSGRTCLVAHNGLNFDFPIVKEALRKLNMNLSQETYCVDSYIAFYEIDKMRPVIINNSYNKITQKEISEEEKSTEIKENAYNKIDWQKINESTPKRPVLKTTHGIKPKYLSSETEISEKLTRTPDQSPNESAASPYFKSRRCLFPNNKNASRPPKGLYKLDQIYERVFQQPPKISHYAEADVLALTKIILHYGKDFMEYAEQKAIPFSEVRALGAK